MNSSETSAVSLSKSEVSKATPVLANTVGVGAEE